MKPHFSSEYSHLTNFFQRQAIILNDHISYMIFCQNKRIDIWPKLPYFYHSLLLSLSESIWTLPSCITLCILGQFVLQWEGHSYFCAAPIYIWCNIKLRIILFYNLLILVVQNILQQTLEILHSAEVGR